MNGIRATGKDRVGIFLTEVREILVLLVMTSI